MAESQRRASASKTDGLAAQLAEARQRLAALQSEGRAQRDPLTQRAAIELAMALDLLATMQRRIAESHECIEHLERELGLCRERMAELLRDVGPSSTGSDVCT